jgi:NAD-dependent deacetylase
MTSKKIVVLSGAGISAESGINTFRDSGGLWEGHDVMEVASPEGWRDNKELVLDFYNQRRRDAKKAKPNKGHQILVDLENYFDVTIVTQNVDDLHERAGSTNVVHLHGELFKSRSTRDSQLVYDMKGTEIKLGDKCERGYQLRPHIVWFGEAVPMIEEAARICSETDIVIIVGTSMQVYPAASLINYVAHSAPKFLVDPNIPEFMPVPNLETIEKVASKGLQEVYDRLIAKYVGF